MAHILLIEDEKVVAETLEVVLMSAGHEVTVAANGVIGTHKFSEIRPDLVITDIIMPEQDGLDTIRRIRDVDVKVPIIAYSGGGRAKSVDFLTMANKFGANGVLRKPFASEELIAMVNHWLSRRTEH